jgi:hypothetical protein
VSVPDQLLYVYRNGVRIGHSTVSTGKPGKSNADRRVHHPAEDGLATHRAFTKGAQMPHMQRLTWSGIALHAEHLQKNARR